MQPKVNRKLTSDTFLNDTYLNNNILKSFHNKNAKVFFVCNYLTITSVPPLKIIINLNFSNLGLAFRDDIIIDVMWKKCI